MRKPPVSIVEAQRLAAEFFALPLPLTLAILKDALRRQQARWHPDRHPGQEAHATEQFKLMMDAYNSLTKCMAAFKESDTTEHTVRTEDGRLLSELGIGLGPTVNGRDCDRCNHKGYSITFEQTWVVCDDCDENCVPLEVTACRACAAGIFTLRSGRKVTCRECNGTGKVKRKSRVAAQFERLWGSGHGFRYGCESCGGTKRKRVDDKLRPVYHTCRECKGAGELRIFNPVIRKGALSGKRQK